MNQSFSMILEYARRLRHPFSVPKGHCPLCLLSLETNHIAIDDYLLCITVLHQGTRSEGSIGRLLHNGKLKTGTYIGETITVTNQNQTIQFTWQGTERPHLWSRSGWIQEKS